MENKFNVNLPTSEISKINSSNGNKIEISDDVFFVLKTAMDFANLSHGRFNPALGELIKLWGINTDHAKVPTQNELDESLKKIDFTKLELSTDGEKKFACILDSISLDLGGIAKGYACDKIVSILKEKKVKQALIDLGGNIYVYGKKSDGRDWTVGVKNPLSSNMSTALGISMDEGTVVTSGTYERFFETDGKKYHHILDTKTGMPMENNLASVTIVCRDSILADALSTTIFALGKDEGLVFLENLKQSDILFDFDFDLDLGVIFIDKNGKISASKNLQTKIIGGENIAIDYL